MGYVHSLSIINIITAELYSAVISDVHAFTICSSCRPDGTLAKLIYILMMALPHFELATDFALGFVSS